MQMYAMMRSCAHRLLTGTNISAADNFRAGSSEIKHMANCAQPPAAREHVLQDQSMHAHGGSKQASAAGGTDEICSNLHGMAGSPLADARQVLPQLPQVEAQAVLGPAVH